MEGEGACAPADCILKSLRMIGSLNIKCLHLRALIGALRGGGGGGGGGGSSSGGDLMRIREEVLELHLMI